MHAHQLGGFFDDFDFDLTGVGDWFTTPPTTSPTPTPSTPPVTNLQFLTGAVLTYLRERDLNKLNRDLIENGQRPLSMSQADYMAQQYRMNGSLALPGQSSLMTWLPWIALAGVTVFLLKK